MRKNKSLKFLLISLSVILLFTGCGKKDDGVSKDELKQVIIILSDELDAANDNIDMLDSRVEAYKRATTNEESVSIKLLEDKSGRTGFVTSESGKLIFPAALEIEGLTKIPNTSRIIIGENISITPSNNWVTVLDGGTLYLSHPENINGVIKLARTQESIKKDAFDEVLNVFFENFPTSTVVYSDVFLNDVARGRVAKANLFVDEKESQMIVFMLANSGVVTMGMFEFDTSAVKNELVTGILNTLSYSSNTVRIDN